MFYLNNAGKIAVASTAVSVAKAAASGDSTEQKSGCIASLIVWTCWVSLILTAFYWLVFK